VTTATEHDPGPLEAAFERSLGPWRALGSRLAQLAERHGIDADALEPSIRGGEGLPLRGGRMMIERAPPMFVRELLAVLVPAAGEGADQLLRVAEFRALPLITGWDTSGQVPVAKLYLNASDASKAVRVRVAHDFIGDVRGVPDSPHVVGLNVGENVLELKLYEQCETLGDGAPEPLRRWAHGLELAGVVRSVQVQGDRGSERAWFVSPRSDAAADRRLSSLPGWSDAAAAACLPGAPGPVTSVGFSSDGRRWTAYFKPRAIGTPSWKLDPDVCVADEVAEIGIFVEPAHAAARAYCRSSAWAVSYRVREGKPDATSIDAAMRWALAQAETGGAIDLSHPPEPWRVVRSR
jgi:hypothetical protein